MRVLTSPRLSDCDVMSSRREESVAARVDSWPAWDSAADFSAGVANIGAGSSVVCVPTSRWKSSDGSSTSESESRSRLCEVEPEGGGGSSETDDSSLDIMEDRLLATEEWKSERESLRRLRSGWRYSWEVP